MNKFEAYWSKNKKDGRLIFRQIERNKPFYSLIIKLLKNLSDKPSCLEIGCGTAIDSYYLKNALGLECTALDISTAAIEQASRLKQYFPLSINLMVSDMFKIGLPDNSFDIIFSQGVMEHFSDPIPAYKEQLRLLKKGGYLIIHVPQKNNIYSILQNRLCLYGKEYPYTENDFIRLAKNLGLKLVKVEGQGIFSIELLRYLYTQLFLKNIRDYKSRPAGIVGTLSYAINGIEKLANEILGEKYSKHVLMNIVGIFEKE